MKRYLTVFVALIAVFALSACSDESTSPVATDSGAQFNNAAPKKGDQSIAAIAIAEGFDELVAALGYVDSELNTGLVDLFLNGTDQYTVFAPTDVAFEGLYELLSAVLETEIDEITDVPAPVVLDVLLYHVAEGRRAANSVVPKNKMRTITPLLEEPFYVRTNGTIKDGLTGLRDDAAIVLPNVSASNGIIHAIDQVIVPPSVVAALTN